MLEASSKSMTSDTTPVSIGDPVDTSNFAKNSYESRLTTKITEKRDTYNSAGHKPKNLGCK